MRDIGVPGFQSCPLPILTRTLFSPAPRPAGGLGELGRLPAEEIQERIRRYQGGFRWLPSPGIVSIAAPPGHAISAGAPRALPGALRAPAGGRAPRPPGATPRRGPGRPSALT